ncbi:MAG: hypothetical protein K2X35_09525 [Bryobacteraceae bacterium]|nr:hypothetical protein [Bryobacteraceae bacterium]
MKVLKPIEFLLEQQVKHGDNTASEKAAEHLAMVREEIALQQQKLEDFRENLARWPQVEPEGGEAEAGEKARL